MSVFPPLNYQSFETNFVNFRGVVVRENVFTRAFPFSSTKRKKVKKRLKLREKEKI